MTKNRKETENKILQAVQAVLIEQGPSNLGVNAIARKANVSKVLIYRYFGSYDELILKFIESMNPFPFLKRITIEYIDSGESDLKKIVLFFFYNLIDYIEDNRGFKEILVWELAFSNSITQKIARDREETSKEIIKYISTLYPGIEMKIQGVSTVLTGGIFYLVARSNTVDIFSGLELNKTNLKAIIKDMINNLF